MGVAILAVKLGEWGELELQGWRVEGWRVEKEKREESKKSLSIPT